MNDIVYRFRFMRPSLLGWSCPQCYWIFPHPAGAILHDERIAENGGICPDRERRPTKGGGGDGKESP
jgi:hypothetical protein